MAEPIFEILSGTIDGVNAVFTFSKAYTPGSTAIYLNGQLILDAATNPWSESDPSSGEITITESACVPRPGDKIAGFALDTTDDPNLVELDGIIGLLADNESLTGTLDDADAFVGMIDDEAGFAGVIADDAFVGTIADTDSIVGILECD